MTLINKEDLMTDVKMAEDIEHIRMNMDQYIMWDMLDLVRISYLGGYHYYKNTLDNDFVRIKAIVGFGYVCGLIDEHDFDNIYWTIVQCQRNMQEEYKHYEEEHSGEFI